MDIMELEAIGELVGGVAVIATLIYLALQIRQSTTATQGTAERELLEGVQRINERIAQNATLFRKGVNSFETLSNDDKLAFGSFFNTFMNHLEQALRMHRRGLLTTESVEVLGAICPSVIQEPSGRQVWERTKPLYFSMSREFIEERIESGRGLPAPATKTLPWMGPDERREV